MYWCDRVFYRGKKHAEVGLVVVLVSVLRTLEVEGVHCAERDKGIKKGNWTREDDNIPEPHSGQRRFFSRVRFIQRRS